MSRKPKLKEETPVTLAFKVGIRCDGEITRVTITQANTEIQLTEAQAIMLGQQLHIRYPYVGYQSKEPK